MFGNSKTEIKNAASAAPTSSSTNSLTQGTAVEGNLHADFDIRIDGALKGNLTCKGKVVIGPTGYIVGDVRCENAVIEGKFEGIMQVADVLHVKETAQVQGDISTSKLVVQPGSIFNVKCKMGDGSQSPTVRRLNPEDEAKATPGKAVLS